MKAVKKCSLFQEDSLQQTSCKKERKDKTQDNAIDNALHCEKSKTITTNAGEKRNQAKIKDIALLLAKRRINFKNRSRKRLMPFLHVVEIQNFNLI